MDVTSNAHFAADTWRAEFASTALPAAFGPDYWAAAEYDRVEISAGFEGALIPLITGQVDDVEYDIIARRLTLSGRDLSAPLIDARTTEKFQNLKSHEIAQRIALRHGLDSNVTATATLAGKYYQIDHAALTKEDSEWDLLCYLAEREGFDVWVRGETLFFQPPVSESQTPYLLLWSDPGAGSPTSNCERLNLSRSQTLAKDVIVKVRSWNQAQEKAFTVAYRASKKGRTKRKGDTDSDAQTYSYTVPNLTREQALKYAETQAAKITRHERLLNADLPGDSLLDTRSLVRLAGTGTDWDQTYYPESVTRRISFEEGYTMQLRAKNHSPQDTVTL